MPSYSTGERKCDSLDELAVRDFFLREGTVPQTLRPRAGGRRSSDLFRQPRCAAPADRPRRPRSLQRSGPAPRRRRRRRWARKRTQAGSYDELHALVEHPRLALGCAGCYLTLAGRAVAGPTARLRREPRQSAAWRIPRPASARERAVDAWLGPRTSSSAETR